MADWIAFGLMLIMAIGAVAGETLWLVKNDWTTAGRAVAFVLITDLIGLGVGAFISFATMGVLIMMALGGSGQGGNAPEAAYWLVLLIGLAAPPLLLFASKRLMLLVLSIRGGLSAWLYSLVLTAMIIIAVFILPGLVFWIGAGLGR